MTQLLVSLFSFITPHLSWAADLVPCGGPNEDACQACYVVILVNGVVHWLVGILSTIAALMIAYAGIKLVLSGGNVSAKTAALGTINNVIIGFIIVLGGWLLIDTLLKALVNDQTYGMWNEIQCVQQPEPIYTELVTGIVSNACESSTLEGCVNQLTTCQSGGGTGTINNSQAQWMVDCTYSGGLRAPDLSAGGACDSTVVSPIFGDQTGNAQCIIQAESVCGARNVSRSDVMADGRAFSFGPMQINLTVHELRNCNGHGYLDCKSAFSGRNYTATVSNEALYLECATAAQDTDCSLRNGLDIFHASGWGAWSTARSCGLRR